MKLKLTKPVVISGHPGLAVGDIFESNDRGLLVYCVEVADEPRRLEIETRDPEVENRDPEVKITKRTRKTLP